MGDFEEKLESILNNPQAMSQIMSLAQSLGGSGDQPAPSPSQPAPPSADDSGLPLDPNMLSSLLSMLNRCSNNDDHRVALLNALRPFVKEHRQSKIDQAIQIARLSRIARMALEMFKAKEDDHV